MKSRIAELEAVLRELIESDEDGLSRATDDQLHEAEADDDAVIRRQAAALLKARKISGGE